MKPAPLLFPWLMGSLLILGAVCAVALADPNPYPQTLAALQERYADEVVAHRKYGAYASHAGIEGYPAIAHLFRALAASEAVHARNFARLIRDLGAEPSVPPLKFKLSTTREHLKQAATVEAAAPVPAEPEATPDVTRIEASEQARNTEQIEELGCCFIWAVNAEQIEELGPYYWNQAADQVEELGPFYWNQATDQVEELGPFYWNE